MLQIQIKQKIEMNRKPSKTSIPNLY